MILYHFCADKHVKNILRKGLTKGRRNRAYAAGIHRSLRLELADAEWKPEGADMGRAHADSIQPDGMVTDH